MATVAPTPIDALPTPPSSSDPTNFDTRADAFLGALPTYRTQANNLGTNVYNNATAAETAATAAELAETHAETAEANAEAAQAIAEAAAAAATNAGNVNGTSTSSVAIATGTKAFTFVEASRTIIEGMWLMVASDADPANYMFGQVTGWNSGTKVVTLNVTAVGGSGTLADWNISLSGPRGANGSNGSNGSNGVDGRSAPNGFTLSYSSATVLGIAAGVMMDSTDAVEITGTAFTKSTAGSWTAGSGNNGMGQGLTIANDTWYHVFAAIVAGSYDGFLDTSVTAANKPASTTAFARIGSVKTNGSAQIISFVQSGQYVRLTGSTTADLNGTPASSATLLAVNVPPGVNVRPMLTVYHTDNGVGNALDLWSGTSGSTRKSEFTLQAIVTGVQVAGTTSNLETNTSQQIYYTTNGASSPTSQIRTFGWIDPTLSPIN